MKPHREIFRAALDQLGVAADRTMFVGDRIDKDVEGSARVGMTTVLVAGNGRAPKSRIRPDHIIRRLTELPSVLQIQDPTPLSPGSVGLG